MATQKELLLEALKGGKREKENLISDVADITGAGKKSVRRRLNELAVEGHLGNDFSIHSSPFGTCISM